MHGDDGQNLHALQILITAAGKENGCEKRRFLYFRQQNYAFFGVYPGKNFPDYEKGVKKLFRFVKKYETKYCNFMSASV